MTHQKLCIISAKQFFACLHEYSMSKLMMSYPHLSFCIFFYIAFLQILSTENRKKNGLTTDLMHKIFIAAAYFVTMGTFHAHVYEIMK